MVENRSLGTEGIRRNNEEGIRPLCSQEDDWGHIFRYEETTIWDMRFRSIYAETDIMKTKGCKNKKQ
jgi:hypothetical protein